MTDTRRVDDNELFWRKAEGTSLRHYFHPVCRVGDLDSGPKAVTLLEEDLVVWAGPDGPVAMRDLCVHRGTRLSLGCVADDGGAIICPYHAWEYGDDGVCRKIPALPATSSIPRGARTTAYATEVAYDLVWVALDEPKQPVPRFPEDQWDDEAFRGFHVGQQTWAASAGRMVENFNDLAHLPFVHENLLATPDKAIVPPHEIWKTDTRIGFTFEDFDDPDGVHAPSNYVTNIIDTPTVLFETVFPFTCHLTNVADDARTIVSLAVCPHSPHESTGFFMFTRNVAIEPEADEGFGDFLLQVVAGDKRIVESLRPKEVPLDLREELHLKVPDHWNLEFRPWFAAKLSEGWEYLD